MELLETKRLQLRPFNKGDSDFILELLNTEGWIKYIGDRNVKTTEQAIGYLENGPLKSYRAKDFGLRLVVLKESGKPIGMCGLVKRNYLDHPDLGFAFLPAYTGYGYAYEIGTATVEHALKELQNEKIFAITLPDNLSSIKLLQKMRFTFVRRFITNDGEELSLYSVGQKSLS